MNEAYGRGWERNRAKHLDAIRCVQWGLGWPVDLDPGHESAATADEVGRWGCVSAMIRDGLRVALDLHDEDSTGFYTVTYNNLIVSEEFSRQSRQVAKLAKDTQVKVVQIGKGTADGRVRARITSPAGWISLRWPNNDKFASKIGDLPHGSLIT
jgi:hypothetical protein